MKNAYRRYSLALLSCGLAVIAVMFAFALYLDPFWGDLTRLGWYAENLYGPNAPEKVIKDKLFDKDSYDRYYDVVVIGDSFSHPNIDPLAARRVWQNRLFLRTGLSLTTFHVERKDWRELVASPTFQASPPKLLIYEEVERNLMVRLGKPPQQHEKCDEPPVRDDAAVPPVEVAAVPDGETYFTTLDRPHNRFDEKQLAFARDFLVQRLKIATGRAHTPVVEYVLNSPLFSSQRPDHLLVYDGDVAKRQWQDEALKNVGCNLRVMQREVEKNRRTHFVAFIVPDKLSAYYEFIAKPEFKDLSVLERIDARGVHLARIDRPLRDAIRGGQREVYSASNTHLSGDGYRILGDALFDYLIQQHMAVVGKRVPAPRGQLSCSVGRDGRVEIETGGMEAPPSSKVNYYLANKDGEHFQFFVRDADSRIKKIEWKNGALPVYLRDTLAPHLTLNLPAGETGEIWVGWGTDDADLLNHTRYVRCGNNPPSPGQNG